jgi:hypothetical protein
MRGVGKVAFLRVRNHTMVVRDSIRSYFERDIGRISEFSGRFDDRMSSQIRGLVVERAAVGERVGGLESQEGKRLESLKAENGALRARVG